MKVIRGLFLVFVTLAIASCQNKSNQNHNPFIESQVQSPQNSPVFSIYGTRYIESDLPDEIAFSDYNLKYKSYTDFKSNTLAFVAKYNYFKNNPDATLDNLPTFDSFYLNFVSLKEVDEYISKNKIDITKFNEVRLKLITQRIEEFLKTEISSIEKEGAVQFLMSPPVAPLERFNLDKYPNLGTSTAINHIVIISSINCQECIVALNEAQEFVQKNSSDYKLTFIPHVFNLTDVSNYFIESAFCAQEVGSQYFWQIINNQLKNSQLITTQYDDMKLAWDIIRESIEMVDINYDSFLKCMSDKVAIKAKVQESVRKISSIDLMQLPTIFLNGVRIENISKIKDTPKK